jgi:plastocyanin domain-containing protein
MQGIVQIIAGIFMVIMGINMLGIFPWLRRFNLAMPRIFARKIDAQKTANKSPLIIGLLNGLMPCGPLQAMQLYALSTGSPLRGAAAMLIFSLGTVPLMFILGAVGSLLSGTSRGRSFSSRVMKAGAILVAVMGLAMFTNGWSLGGFPRPVDALASLVRPASSPGPAAGETFAPEIADGVQVINSTLSPNRYPAIVVRRGIPVKWVITAAAGSINGCNNRMIIREYGIEHSFTQGENIIEFMPEREGRFSYSCWMGMIRSSITVAAEDAVVADADAATSVATAKPEIIPAGVTIPTDEVAFAELATRETINYGRKYQVVNINLRDDGFSPSVIVLEKDIPTIWTINNDSLEPGNAELIFPAYFTTIPMQDGDNQIELLPRSDFDFSTADNVYYGYVKVVDSIAAVDLSAVRNEVANWETQVYPPEYFEQSSNEQSQSEQSSRASCCQ